MAEIPVAITFPVAPEVVADIAAVDPRIRILDFPAAALRAGTELPPDEKARALATIAEAEVAFGPARIPRNTSAPRPTSSGSNASSRAPMRS